MQLAFQIAYHKLTGKFVPTYESCSTVSGIFQTSVDLKFRKGASPLTPKAFLHFLNICRFVFLIFLNYYQFKMADEKCKHLLQMFVFKAIFRHGRTETLRPGTLETRACAEAFNSSNVRSDAELLSLMQKCSKTHQTLTKSSAQGLFLSYSVFLQHKLKHWFSG